MTPTVDEIHVRYCERNDLDHKTDTIEKTWPNNCYAVATALVDLLPEDARTAYGFWYGKDKRNPKRSMNRHGWALHDGFVKDPTRWVFEKKKPYVFVQKSSDLDDYDEGMAELREAFERPAPERDDTHKKMKFTWTSNESAFLSALFGVQRDWSIMTIAEYFWVANKQPKRILPIVESFYKQLKAQDMIGAVPVDFVAMYKDLKAQGLIDD